MKKSNAMRIRLIVMLLTLCTLLACMAGTAMAADHTHTFESGNGKCDACGEPMAKASVTTGGVTTYYAKLDEALAKASVTTGGVTTYYATLDEALTAAQGKTATVELLKDAQITVGRTITSGVTFDGGEYVIAAATSDVWLNNKGTIAGGTFTGTVVNHRGSVTGGSFNVLKCDRNSSVSGKISFRTLVNLTNSTDYDLSQAVDIEGATVQNSVGELPASKLKLPDGYALAVGRKIVSVLSGGVSSTIVAHPEHIYVDGVCACGLAATYTLALEEDVAGVEIESVSIDGEELILGGEIRVQHGKDLTVKLKNTLSETETDVFAAACTSAGNTIEHTFDGADTLTIPGGSVNQNIYISAVPYVRVQFNLNGGMVTDAGKAKFSSLGCTWDEENDALKALYDTGISDLSDVFGFSGHTFIGVKADGSDDVVSALGVRGDTTVDILWNCDGSTLTHVPAKDATCKEAGNIAHYVCTCSKLYAEDKTTELTAEQIRTPVDPDAHSINAQTGSCVYCGEPMAAASVTIGGVTTYYAKLDEALNAPNGMTATVKLLKDAEITEDHTIPMGVTFDGGKFTVSGEDLVNLGGTIAGGTFKAEVINMGGSIAGGVFDRISYCEGSVYGPISFKHLDNVGYSPSINLSQAVSIEGANISTITSALSVSDLKLPDGYALEVNGQIVSTLQSAQGGTIVAHLEHNYVDGVCGCGEVCDHVIDNDGECACGKVVAAASVTTDGVTTYYATLKEALSAAQGKTAKVDLLKDAEIIGNDSIDLGVTFDGGEFTVSGGHLANGGTIVGGTFTVTIMNFGGSVTGGSFATLYCYNGSVSGEISFETLSNDGDDMDYDLSQAVDIEGATVRNSAAELPASKLKLPDGYALAVGGQIVSVLEQGQNGTIVAHLEHNYVDGVCGCGAECDHAAIDNDGKCTECGLQYAASVTIGDVTTYYTELDDALDDAANETATVRLLADGEMTENVNYDSPSNITLDMNGKTITAKATLSVADEAPLTITGSGIINAAGATPIMITDGVVTVAGDLTFNGAEPGFAFEYPGTLDLSGVNGSIDGWRVMNICTDDEIAVGDNITLPDGYALKVGDNFAAGLNGNETGTIVAHTHEYGTVEYNSLSHWKQCVCGAIDESSKTKHTIAGQINPDGETHRMGCTGCDFVDLGAGSLGHNWNGSGKCEQCPSEAVAKVDDAYFAVFANAVEAWKAESAQAMTLLADVTYGDVIRLQSGGARTLDLNGHTLTNTVMSDYALRHFVPLTVNDSSTNRTGKFIADSVRVSVIYSDSTTLTVNGGTFTTSNRPYALNLNYANAEVNSDNVKLEAVAPINVSGASDSNSLTITGSGCDGWKICNNCWNAVPISIPYGFHLEDEEGKQLAANNSLPAGAYTFIKADHVHAWSYAADDDADVITAVCANADGHCPDTQQSLTLSAADAVYSGNPVEAEVTQDGADLTYTLHYTGTDYDSPDAPVNAGDYTVTMTVGDKSIEKSFTISPKDISAVQSIHFGLSQTSFVYNGEAPVLNVTGVDSSVGSYTMQEGTDYSVGTVQVNAGSHKLTVTGMGNYTGSVELAYEINCAPIDAAVITAEAQVYTGGALEPAFTVKLDGKELKHNEDFVFAFSDNVNVGEGKIVINGIGNYEGQAEGTFAIAMADAALSVQTDKDLYTYGETVTVTASRAAKPATFALRSAIAPDQMALFLGDTQIGEAVDAVDGTYTMTVNTADKELSIGENTLRVVYVSDGNLKDAEATVTVMLLPKVLTIISAGAADRAYEKGNKLVDVTGVDLDGIVVIGDDVKADLTGVQGTLPFDNAGTYITMALPRLILTGSDSVYYTIAADDAVITSVEITPKEITNPTIVLDASSFVYDGTEKKPAVTSVKDGDDLIDAAEYTVSYANNIEMGTATVTLTDVAGGNYTVSGSTTFQITQSGTDMTAVTDQAEYTYGDAIIVSGSVTATGKEPEQETLSLKRAFVAPTAMQAALYDAAGNQITEPVSVVDGKYELTYDTKSKFVAPGEDIVLTVQFTGSASMANQKAQTNPFALKAKELTPVSAQAEDRTYETGNTSVVVTGVTVEGIFDTDEVSVDTANLSGAIASDNAGSYTSVSLAGLVLTGADAAFYTAIDAQTQTSVTIHPKEVTFPEITLDEDEFVYDGTEKKPNVVSVKDVENEIPAAEYTVSYEANVEAGTAKVIITDAEGGNYTVSGEKEFSIVTSATAMSAETDQAEYTYGDAIIVSGSVEATGKEPEQETLSLKRAFVAPAAMQAALYDAAGNQITKPVSVVDGKYELTYDTKSKLVAPGEDIVLTVQFTGNASMANQKAQTNRFALKAKELTPVSAQAEDRTYEPGNTTVVVTGVTVEGIFDTDKVSVDTANLSGAIASDNAGTYTSVSLAGLVLTGADAAFYTAIDAQTQTSVTIHPKEVTLPEITLDEDEFVYDGTEKKPNVVSVKDGENEIPAAEYTVSYEANVEAGTAKVIITDAEGGNYTVSGEKEFSIVTSDTAMTAETDQAEYTYGDAIIVSGSVTATGKEPQATGFSLLRAFIAPAAMQAALYDAAGNQITEPVSVVDGKYELTYDTKSKLVAPGEDIVLTVQFTGNASMANQKAQTNRFALKAKELTAELSGSTAKTYDAGTDVTDASNLAFTLKEVFEGDSVTAEAASFAFEDANAGTGKNVIAQGIVLSGEDAQFYQLAENTAQAAVGTITPATAPEIIFPTAGGITYGQALESSALTGGSTEHGSFAWQDGTVVPPAGSGSYTVVFTPKDALNYDYTAVEGWNAETGTVERTVVIAVAKAAGEVRVTIEGWVYGAEPNAPVPESATHGTQNVTFLYKAKDADESAYSDKVPSQVGEYTVKAIFAETENYLQASAEADFAITMSQTTFDGGLGVYNGDKETVSFTYGDTITVKAKPTATGESVWMRLWRSSVSADKMALFAGDVQLSEETAANADGVYEMTYDTTQKLLPLGESSITAKYVSDGNKDDYSQSVNVTIAKKELTVAGVSAKDRIFKAGNTKVTVTGVTLCGVVGSDEVYTEVKTGDTGSDQIGTYENVTLPAELELKGADAQWYTISGGASVPANGESGVRILAVPDDLALRVSLNGELTDSDLSEALIEAGYSTVEEVLAAFEAALGKPKGSTVSELLELQLHYTEDGGETWIEAGAEHFPKGETLLVSLPVPEGTDPKTHTYHVTVMYTEDMNGHRAGEIRQIEATPRLKEDGTWVLDVQVDGLVLMLVRAKANPAALPETGDSSSLALWMTMMGVSLLAMGCLRRRRAL